LVFTDVRMPGTIDGIALARLVRSEYPDIKIMMASGHLTDVQSDEFVDEFFVKPYNLHTVVRQIDAILLESDRGQQND
jgi:two-component system, response regulator PdtaR